MMVSGEVGSGKTMLLRTLIEKLPDDTEIVYIPIQACRAMNSLSYLRGIEFEN